MKTGRWQVEGRCLSVLSHFLCSHDDKNIILGRAQKLGHGVVVENIRGREGGGLKGGEKGRWGQESDKKFVKVVAAHLKGQKGED